MKKILLGLSILLFLFIAYLIFNTLTFSTNQIAVEPIAPIGISESAIGRFQEALRIRTISFGSETDIDSTQFDLFNEFMKNRYPNVHTSLDHKVFNNYSHMFTWKGANAPLDPIVLMAHLDVVPIAARDKWSVDPFAGIIKDDIIWGRGAMDDKFAVIAILEAVEMMLTEGFQPKRTIILSFGHDEEIGGENGALVIAEYLAEQGITPEFVLDEGMAVSQGMIPNVAQDIAFIGTAEKGIVSIEMIVNQEGGHSSQPSKETAIDILANAVAKLKANPLEGRLTEVIMGFMDQIGPEMNFLSKVVFANKKIFRPLIIRMYSDMSNSGNALIRTTTSPTIFQSGVKENVIPGSARAVVNFRIIPGQVGEDILAHVNEVVDDERVETRYYGPLTNPSPVSPTDTESYSLIQRTIKETHPDVLTSPNLVIGATDSRHFTMLSPNIYRFSPFHIHEGNLTCFHGVDERVPVSDFENAIRFYRQLILNGD